MKRHARFVKLCSLMLAAALICLSVPVHVVALEADTSVMLNPRLATVSNISILLNSVAQEPEAYGISSNSLHNLSLGEQIPTYILSDDDPVETSSYVYPLYSGNELIAHITSFYVGNTLESMISTELSSVVNELLNENSTYAIVYDCDGVQLVSSQGIEPIAEYSTDPNLGSVYSYVEDNSDLALYIASTNEAASTIPIAFDSIDVMGTNGSGNTSMEVYKYYQGNTLLCWAYSVASIGNTLFGSELHTGVEVAMIYWGSDYNRGLAIAGAIDTLNFVYPCYYEVSSSTLSESTAYDHIDAGFPIYMNYQTPDTKHAHAVVLRAINTSSHYFSIMNPGSGTYQGYTNTSGAYSITYNSRTYNLYKWGYSSDIT